MDDEVRNVSHLHPDRFFREETLWQGAILFSMKKDTRNFARGKGEEESWFEKICRGTGIWRSHPPKESFGPLGLACLLIVGQVPLYGIPLNRFKVMREMSDLPSISNRDAFRFFIRNLFLLYSVNHEKRNDEQPSYD